jgi:hypothetical protein
MTDNLPVWSFFKITDLGFFIPTEYKKGERMVFLKKGENGVLKN